MVSLDCDTHQVHIRDGLHTKGTLFTASNMQDAFWSIHTTLRQLGRPQAASLRPSGETWYPLLVELDIHCCSAEDELENFFLVDRLVMPLPYDDATKKQTSPCLGAGVLYQGSAAHLDQIWYDPVPMSLRGNELCVGYLCQSYLLLWSRSVNGFLPAQRFQALCEPVTSVYPRIIGPDLCHLWQSYRANFLFWILGVCWRCAMHLRHSSLPAFYYKGDDASDKEDMFINTYLLGSMACIEYNTTIYVPLYSLIFRQCRVHSRINDGASIRIMSIMRVV